MLLHWMARRTEGEKDKLADNNVVDAEANENDDKLNGYAFKSEEMKPLAPHLENGDVACVDEQENIA